MPPPVSPFVSDQTSNYFAHYALGAGGNGGGASIGKKSPQDKAMEAARKEQDKQQAEEAKRLRQILIGHGVPKGQAEGMSVGELKGTLDDWTMKHARRLEAEKQKQQESQQQFKNDLDLQDLGLKADDIQLRKQEREAKLADKATLHAQTKATMEREQRALGMAGMEGSIQSGQGMFAGPMQAPTVAPGQAAGQAYLQGGGQNPQMLRAMGEVFTPPKSDQISWSKDPLGNPIGTMNGQVVRMPVAREEQAPRYFGTVEEAQAAIKAAGQEATHEAVPVGPGRVEVKAKPSVAQSIFADNVRSVVSGAAPTPTPTPTPKPVTPRSFSF